MDFWKDLHTTGLAEEIMYDSLGLNYLFDREFAKLKRERARGINPSWPFPRDREHSAPKK